jgi:hypothetical protein
LPGAIDVFGVRRDNLIGYALHLVEDLALLVVPVPRAVDLFQQFHQWFIPCAPSM